MDIRISSLNNLIKETLEFEPDFVISIIDESLAEDVKKLLKSIDYDGYHLLLIADDYGIEDKKYLLNNPSKRIKKPKFFSFSHLNKVYQFSENIDNNSKVLFHCNAGISRSTALAFGFLVLKGYEPVEAFKKVTEIRPMHYMNDLIVSHWERFLRLEKQNRNIDLMKLFTGWDEFLDNNILTDFVIKEKIPIFIERMKQDS